MSGKAILDDGTVITVKDMMCFAEKVHNKLKRNFTPEEWNFYIGKDVPYETFIDE